MQMLYNLAVFRLFTVRSFHELRKRLISLETGLALFLPASQSQRHHGIPAYSFFISFINVLRNNFGCHLHFRRFSRHSRRSGNPYVISADHPTLGVNGFFIIGIGPGVDRESEHFHGFESCFFS